MLIGTPGIGRTPGLTTPRIWSMSKDGVELGDGPG